MKQIKLSVEVHALAIMQAYDVPVVKLKAVKFESYGKDKESDRQ